MSSPDFHGEEITNPEQKRQVDEGIAAIEEQLAGTAADRLAQQLVPVVPDGGTLGQALTPKRVEKAAKVRDWLRIWAPGIAATVVFVFAVALFPIPGPLLVYGLAVVGFGWWHAAGRPAPADAARMVAYTTSDAATRVRGRIERLTQRRTVPRSEQE
ncbi:hypothetical protein [Nocardia sp. CC227C]|uniref:hypothetical protein n=1 Tax=Nocardia sp. CC227C TaxID=3044562 RepID=UPI00278BCA52|nr:hypothetical protein [Nocardia sp. CC227C]